MTLQKLMPARCRRQLHIPATVSGKAKKNQLMKVHTTILILVLLFGCGQLNNKNSGFFESSTELYSTYDKDYHLQPEFYKSEFDTLHMWDFGWAILKPINIATDEVSENQLSKRLSPGQKALYFFWYLDAEVTNGGFIQFYWNDYRKYLSPILDGLKLIGDEELIDLIDKADKQYIANKQKFDLQRGKDDWEPLYDSLKEFDVFDSIYYKIHDKSMALIEEYVRHHPSEFVKLK
jgi:hypothetical protein